MSFVYFHVFTAAYTFYANSNAILRYFSNLIKVKVDMVAFIRVNYLQFNILF